MQQRQQRMQYPKPSPRFVGQLSAVTATKPVAPASAGTFSSPSLHLAHLQQQQQQETSAAAHAAAHAARLSSHHLLQSLQPLPHNSHLPPPIVSAVTGDPQPKSSLTALHTRDHEHLKEESAQTLDLEGPVSGIGGVAEAEPRAAARAGPAATKEAVFPTQPLWIAADPAAESVASVAPTSAYTAARGVTSIDPFLAASVLQHLSHVQRRKNPELLSALLASVSVAAEEYQLEYQLQQRNQYRPLAIRGPPRSVSEPVLVLRSSSPPISGAAVSSGSGANGALAASAVNSTSAAPTTGPAAEHPKWWDAAVGTDQLRGRNAALAEAAALAAGRCSKNSGKDSTNSIDVTGTYGGNTNASHANAPTRKTSKKASEKASRGALVTPTGKGTIKRLQERGAHRSLDFVLLPWNQFVSQYRKAVDLNSTSSMVKRRGGAGGKGLVTAGAEVMRAKTKREARPSLFLYFLCCVCHSTFLIGPSSVFLSLYKVSLVCHAALLVVSSRLCPFFFLHVYIVPRPLLLVLRSPLCFFER